MSHGKTDHKERRRRFSAVLLAVLVVLGFTLYGEARYHYLNARAEPAANDIPAAVEDHDNLTLAIEALGELAIKDSLSREGYSRARFSPGWAAVEGCDMRNRILRRDLAEVVLDEGGCAVLSGVLNEDPFTGKRIPFQRGRDTSNDIHIEHLVAVSDAWQKGAQDLSYERRREFYNDPLNLLAVDGPANMEKGDKDAAGWLPRAEYRCRYVARQIAVKLRYALWATRQEFDAMKRVLNSCPGQFLPVVESNGTAR